MIFYQDKKAVLTTVIQEVRALRTKAQDLETDYIEKKKVYDTTIASLERYVPFLIILKLINI